MQNTVQSWAIRQALGCVNSQPEEAMRRGSRNLGPTLYPIPVFIKYGLSRADVRVFMELITVSFICSLCHALTM